jgi:hypothetical protein
VEKNSDDQNIMQNVVAWNTAVSTVHEKKVKKLGIFCTGGMKIIC